MKKTFVLDTNVILHTPLALNSFADNDIVIPAIVLEELDRFKKDSSELGANARLAARFIDELREKGDLIQGVPIPSGGTLRVELNCTNVTLPDSWPDHKNDNRILKVCMGLMDEGENVFLVTKDIFERIKADLLNIPVQDFLAEQVPSYEEQYRGILEVYTNDLSIDQFYETGKIDIRDVFEYSQTAGSQEPVLVVNQFLIIHSYSDENKSALGRFNGEEIVCLQHSSKHPFGITPKNANQKFMQEALMLDADIAPLVIFKGPAGTAKTFYSLAVGLHKIMNEKDDSYRKILVCRPNIKMDEEIGFLPGNEQEKIAPFMRPIIDNLEILIDSNSSERYKNEVELKDKIDELFERNIITTEAIAFIRGRSIVKQWIIIDEAQNLTPRQVKGIITRAGKHTKIILIGDPGQIDHPFLDSRTNGLCYASEKMKESPLCFQLTLSEKDCERSELAFESSRRMK
ncbi:MAG: PhoH family protein [Clostridia bacterium]|nr:PhoH family protein [Clostridia bacterium]